MVANAKTFILTLGLLIISSSCAGSYGRTSSPSTFRGFSLQATRPDPIDIVWSSTTRALDSLKISITKRRHSSDKAQIKGVTVEDNSVKISMWRLNANTTRIAIRVGVFGDQRLSREILRRIDSNLELQRYENIRSIREQN
jgi:hypothetical protein